MGLLFSAATKDDISAGKVRYRVKKVMGDYKALPEEVVVALADELTIMVHSAIDEIAESYISKKHKDATDAAESEYRKKLSVLNGKLLAARQTCEEEEQRAARDWTPEAVQSKMVELLDAIEAARNSDPRLVFARENIEMLRDMASGSHSTTQAIRSIGVIAAAAVGLQALGGSQPQEQS